METEMKPLMKNSSLSQSMKRLNSAGVIRREEILKIFPAESVEKCWDIFCKSILRNYQAGKGTSIPKFGVFTFNNAEVNLEGTTNQFNRDLKARRPVFIVSSSFVDKVKPGIFNLSNGVVYYTQQQSNNISHVKVNFAEMAYSLGMNKEEVTTILDHLIKFIGDSIIRNEFKNKEMGGLGTLVLRNNILAVKFNEDFLEGVKLMPQKLLQTKKQVNLFMEINEKADNGSPLAKSVRNLRPKTAVVTKITQGGENWLKENYDIDLNNLEEEKQSFSKLEPKELNLINDVKHQTCRRPQKLADLNISSFLLESIYFHKGVILSELKNQDRNNTGILKKYEFLSAFALAKVNPLLTSHIVSELLNLYSEPKSDFVNYTNAMGSLLKDIQSVANLYSNTVSRELPSRHVRPLSASLNNQQLANTTTKDFQQNNSLNNSNTIYGRKVELEEITKEIKTIKLILTKLKQRNSTMMDQNRSIGEFMNILRDFTIVFPKQVVTKILNFLEINDISSFCLQEFCDKLDKCKILSSEMTSEGIIEAFHKLKDIVYSLGGRSFIFNEQKGQNSLSKEEFVNLLKAKTHFSEDLLQEIFIFITKTDRNLTLEDYLKHFEETKNNKLDEDFQIRAIITINQKIHRSAYKHDEYFNQLLSYKKNKSESFLTKIEFHKALISEKFAFTAEEIDYLFKIFDSKKDNIIDREEFNQILKKVYKALYKIKDIIKKNNLEIEDLLYRMNIDLNKNDRMDFYQFKGKIKLLDPTFDHDFIQSLFNEMKSEDQYVDQKTLAREFNVFKKEHFVNTNNESFRQNFIIQMKQSTSYGQLKQLFEKIDTFNNGLLTKVDFCNVILTVTQEYREEDIMKFTRIASLISSEKVNYPQFLDMIFYNSKENKFTEIVDKLTELLINDCQKDIHMLFSKINGTVYKKPIGKVFIENSSNQFITIDRMNDYLSKKCSLEINKNLVCKLDLDLDGRISIHDLKGILERYNTTLFFKYENSDKTLDVNLFTNELITDEKFKQIVKDIKQAMKQKNITEIGLFNKLDSNKDGFVSHTEFCRHIDDVISLSPGIKDKFFNYLDIRNLGMVDIDTFLKRFKEFQSADVVVKNNWDIEVIILTQFANWFRSNNKLTGDELFAIIDFDCDGIIGLQDFKKFILEKLNFSKNDLNDFKLERAMQRISLTKNINIGLADLKEFIHKSKSGNLFQEISTKLTLTNSNLNDRLKNADWVQEAVTKLGLFVSENYDSVDQFFEEITLKNSGKLLIEEFKHFIEKQHKCFDGFNFTSDEITTIFSALDPHKKNFVSLEDLKNKLLIYDFYKKMHLDIKIFTKENFIDGLETFKYFKRDFNINDEINSVYLTKKEMFSGINNLFPGKYQTNTILKYIKKKFKSEDQIYFSEFNYVYFDEIKKNETVLNKNLTSLDRIKSGKLTQRSNALHDDVANSRNNENKLNVSRAKSASVIPFSNTQRIKLKLHLATPFDEDALEKVKRIIHSSRFDFTNFFKMYELVSENGLLNQFEFRNMLKKLNLGLTSLEIDQIINKSGKSREGKINIRDFAKFISSEDPNLVQLKKNVVLLFSEIKQLIYKYYTTPKLAFQYNDKNISHQMDFTKFKQIISELFERETRPAPNFALLKNAFDYVDLRKDGIIDLNEWLKAFSFTESSLDIKNVANPSVLKELREWENSRDVSILYGIITRNKKVLKEKARELMLKQGKGKMIHADNLIALLKEIMTHVRLTNTHWKMIVNIADREKNSMIDFEYFMSLVETSTRQSTSHPIFK